MRVHCGRRRAISVLMLCLATSVSAPAQDEEDWVSALPRIDLEVADADLAWMLAQPYDERSAPVRIVSEGQAYLGEIRIRGGTSRSLPKPSWRIELPDADNVFRRRHVLLRAEYRDASAMRNHLAHRLFRRFGFRTPETRFVRIHLNGEDAGVYLHVERIDAAFLDSRGLARGDLFSLEMNAGRWYPYLDRQNLPIGWNGRILTSGAHRRIEEVLLRLGFASHGDFPQIVDDLFDADEVLRYYAIVYGIMGRDAMIDNYYVYHNPTSHKFEFIPWDLDATFGNAFDGTYDETLEDARDWGFIHSNLLQRMLEYPHWKTRFENYVRTVAIEGSGFVEAEIHRIAGWLRDEIMNDPSRHPEHISFDEAVGELHHFLGRRRDVLLDNGETHRFPLYAINVSKPHPTPEEPIVEVHVHAVPSKDLFLWLAYDIRRYDWSASREEKWVQLLDDGETPDSVADDGWYAARVDLSEQMGDFVTMGVTASNAFLPAPAVFNAHFITSATYAFNLRGGTEESYRASLFEPVLRIGDDAHIPLLNQSGIELDYSGFYVQAGPSFQRVVIPWETIAPVDGRIVITTNVAAAMQRFPDAVVVGGLAVDVNAGDSLLLQSPMQTPLVQTRAEVRTDDLPRILINEVNYRSTSGADAGDWVELMSLEQSETPIGGWQLLDGDDDHVYPLPQTATISPGSFVIVAADTNLFRSIHDVDVPVYGGFSFGFDGAGELVRLRNDAGELVSMVAYQDASPWPKDPDGRGATLELVSPELDPMLPESWGASLEPGGTPGRPNSITTGAEPVPPSATALKAVYPNPVRDVLWIVYDLEAPADVGILLFDVLGRRVSATYARRQSGRSHTDGIDMTNLASGTYVVLLEINGIRSAARPIVHVR